MKPLRGTELLVSEEEHECKDDLIIERIPQDAIPEDQERMTKIQKMVDTFRSENQFAPNLWERHISVVLQQIVDEPLQVAVYLCRRLSYMTKCLVLTEALKHNAAVRTTP